MAQALTRVAHIVNLFYASVALEERELTMLTRTGRVLLEKAREVETERGELSARVHELEVRACDDEELATRFI